MNQKLLQLYAWYPVKGGCPHCGKAQNIPTPPEWLHGNQSTALTRCSECNQGYYVQIAEKKSGKLEPVDLSKLGNRARPKAHEVVAKKADGIVLMPHELLAQGGDA